MLYDFSAHACYLCWWRKRKVFRRAQLRPLQFRPVRKVRRKAFKCLKESEQSASVPVLHLLTSVCNFSHPPTNFSFKGTDCLHSSELTALSDGSAAQSGSSLVNNSQSGSRMSNANSDSSDPKVRIRRTWSCFI